MQGGFYEKKIFSTLPAAVLAENAETEPNTVQETEPLPAVQNGEENGIAVQISGYTAKIGNIQYATLTEAFDAANTYNGATIELLKNVELSSEADSANQNLWVGACDFHEYTSSEDSTRTATATASATTVTENLPQE